jgi:acyl dehydratase
MSYVRIPTLALLQQRVGEHLATRDWLLVRPQHIHLFAQATGDHPWIHVDVERVS